MLTKVLSCLFEISSTGPVELDVVAEYAVVGSHAPHPVGDDNVPILEDKSRHEHRYPFASRRPGVAA